MNQRTSTSWTAHVGDLAFRMDAPTGWAEAQQRYLHEYLPGRLGDRELGTFHLEMHLDDEARQQVAWQVMQPPIAKRIEPVPGVVLLETRTSSGGRCYAVAADGLEHQGQAYAVRVHNRHIELYLHRAARQPHGYPLRLMREAMFRTYEDHGGLVFHAAGADLGGRGVMLCGPRSAGKTTLLTCLLRYAHGALLSNDRLILDEHGRLIPVPLPVPIAKGTIDAVPELDKATTSLSRPQAPIPELPAMFGARTKAEFTAREYASALNTSLAAGSSLETIIVPQLSDSSEPARWRALSPESAQELLRANCFTPHDEFWRQPWLVPRTTPNSELCERAEQLVRELSEQVPCFEVRFGIRNSLDSLVQAVHEVVTHP